MNSRPLLTVADVSDLTGFSVRTIYDMVNDGRIPKPRKIGPRFTRWLRADIEQWINDGCPTSTSEGAASE